MTILHVEDDLNDVCLLQRAFDLEQVGHPLQTARDGVEAIDYLAGEGQFADRSRYPLPGLVLLDLKLPKRNGLEVLEWIRAQRELEALPVAFLTSAFQAADVMRAYQLGISFFIMKPFGFDELRGIVRFLKTWVLHMMPPQVDEKDWVALTSQDLWDRWPQLGKRAA